MEFPDVFELGGFDVMLGNPPWERIKLQEQEFFAIRDPNIANARTASERKNLIKRLPESNPILYQEFINACHDADASSKFIRDSGRFELTGEEKYCMPFSFELFYKNIHSIGMASMSTPSGYCNR